jgi:multidrug resistance efflux pump
MAHISPNVGRGFASAIQATLSQDWMRSPRLTGRASWRHIAKFGIGAALVTVGAVTTYQQLGVRASREAVINARVSTIRAPMDGIIKATANPGQTVQAGVPIGDIEDPTADDARLFQLQQDARAAEREHDARLRQLSDLRKARDEADAQAEAYRLGRVHQDELHVEEARANLSAATARERDGIAAERRGAALRARGFMADAAYERVLHAREVAQQDTIAVYKRLDALTVELEAARKGTYLGDNYNDVPSSYQRARELTVRIEEAQTALDQLARKRDTLSEELTAERQRFSARSGAAIGAPMNGNLWTVQVTSGEYVRKGQELFTVLDCSTVVVTASVSDRDYNELRLGDAARFRVAGSGREYSGLVSKLGLTSTGRSFAIAPEERRHQVAVQLTDLQDSPSDRCAVGRTGEVVFEGHGRGLLGRLADGLLHLLSLA